MYYIKKSVFNELLKKHFPDYINKAIKDHTHGGKTCKAGEYCMIECCIPGAPNTGATLIFQHIHFEIIPD